MRTRTVYIIKQTFSPTIYTLCCVASELPIIYHTSSTNQNWLPWFQLWLNIDHQLEIMSVLLSLDFKYFPLSNCSLLPLWLNEYCRVNTWDHTFLAYVGIPTGVILIEITFALLTDHFILLAEFNCFPKFVCIIRLYWQIHSFQVWTWSSPIIWFVLPGFIKYSLLNKVLLLVLHLHKYFQHFPLW